MFSDEKNQISHKKKIIFSGDNWYFWGKKSGERMINLGDQMIRLGG